MNGGGLPKHRSSPNCDPSLKPGQLQNASSLPTATATYAYDGEGQRVWQQSVSGPGGAQTTTTTLYLLGHDEQTTTQSSGQQATTLPTRYYPTPGGALAVRDTTGFSYLPLTNP